MLDFRLPKKFVDGYRNRPVPFGWNGLGKVTFYRTYSRTDNPNVNGMESWVDVCERVINGMYSIQKEHIPYSKWNEEKALSSAMEAFDLMFHFKWTPPGRGLWMMGTPFIHERHEFAALQNCGMLSTESIRQDGGSLFGYFMEMLMLGVGMGFDTRGAGEIEVMQANYSTENLYYVKIEDSREGWANSVKVLVNSYLFGSASPAFDYSAIRPKGTAIKGFGGVASGPEPLIKLHQDIARVLEANQGQPITSRTITDIFNLIGTCVVAGNVRRSAEIALGSPFDEDFINLKDYNLNPQRADYGWTSNNSVIIEQGDKVDYRRLAEKTYNNGEPGYFWIDNARQYGRMNGLFEPDDSVMGANPCLEQVLGHLEKCVTGETYIHTKDGLIQIGDAIGKTVEIWNGNSWSTVTPFYTGRKDVYRVHLSDGSYLDCTEDHEWIVRKQTEKNMRTRKTSELEKGMVLPQFSISSPGGKRVENAYLWGMFAGDGYNQKRGKSNSVVPMVSVFENKYSVLGELGGSKYKEQVVKGCREKLTRINVDGLIPEHVAIDLRDKEVGLPQDVMSMDTESIAEFFGGWIDTDGSLISQVNTDNYVLYGTEQKLRDAQMLLRRIGVNHSSLRLFKPKGHVTNYGTRNYGLWRLHIPSYECVAINTRIKIATRIGNPYRDNPAYENSKQIGTAKNQKIKHIEFIGSGIPTYCLNEPVKHMCVFGNVLTKQCTLVEIHLPHCKTKQEFIRALKYAYLYGKTVTLLSDRIGDESWDIMTQNRRIGLSTTGHTQFIGMHGIDVWKEWLDYGYHKVAGYYDKLYSQWFDIPESVRKTSVKPSGTISLVSGVTPGIHYNVADRYHIRRLTLSDDSPLLSALQRAGYRTEASVYGQGSYVVEFPIDAGPGVKSESDVSIWDQLSIIHAAQEFWADNAVSATVKFRRNEVSVDELANAIEWCSTRLKGISFLPQEDHGYAQAPYESISKEKYYAMLSEIDSAAIDDIGSSEKMMDLYCDGDACVIPQKAG